MSKKSTIRMGKIICPRCLISIHVPGGKTIKKLCLECQRSQLTLYDIPYGRQWKLPNWSKRREDD